MAFGREEDLYLDSDKLLGLYRGIVVDNKDPQKLARVRLIIPGLTPKGQWSDWAWPAAFPFSGLTQRGSYMVPQERASAYVMFVQGERDELVYFTGNWGSTKPEGGSGIPEEPESRTYDEAPKIKAIQTDTFEVLIIDTENEKKVIFKISSDADNGSIEIDAIDGSVKLSAKNWLILEAAGINIDALTVNIKDRIVLSRAAKSTI
jgi:hypothetical protein